MKAMQLITPGKLLVLQEIPLPDISEDQLLIRVLACAVCRTDVHLYQGDLKASFYPITLGHQVVGIVEKAGANAQEIIGQRVGAAWLGTTCGHCFYCLNDEENLCENALFHGKDLHGGFAEYMVVQSGFAFPLPADKPPEKLAPLLCAGMIGYRSYRKLSEATTLGFYGFGSAAHLLLQLAVQENKQVYVFTKDGDIAGQRLALSLGAVFAGPSSKPSPLPLDGAIIFATDGTLVPIALHNVRPSGRVVCAGIHMSDIPSFHYSDLWQEKKLESVANLTRKDGYELLTKSAHLDPQVTIFPLEEANLALAQIGHLEGSLVLLPTP